MILANEHLVDAPLVVLLHGYGADDGDLTGLIPYLPQEFRYASLRAPERVPGMPGYQWFPLRIVATPMGGATVDSSPEAAAAVDAGASRAAEGVWAEIDSLDASRVAFLGFSQGAITGMQAWRQRPDGFVCGVLLSGYVAQGPLQGDAELARLRPPVFWGHGGRDEVIPAAAVAATRPWLEAHTEHIELLEPHAGHEVTLRELEGIGDFLREHLGSAQ